MIRLGIVGLGTIGRHHLQAAQAVSEFEVCAIADPHLPASCDLPPGVKVFARWQDMIEAGNLDAVSVCVPHHLHLPIALTSLNAGLHVLVEKPIALTVQEGQELIDCAWEQRRTLMVEMTHRFYPAMREAQAFVASGAVGEIYAVEDRIIEGVSDELPAWLFDPSRSGGGVALTNGVHMLDRIAAVTGQALSFQSGRVGYNAGLGDIEDTAAMLLSLENGAPVQLLSAWPRGAGVLDDELTIYGTQGTLRVWAWHGWKFEPSQSSKPVQGRLCYTPDEPMPSRVQRGVRAALQEFGESIRAGRAPYPPAQAALEAQKLVEALYEYVHPVAAR